jgi:hypothetical protein
VAKAHVSIAKMFEEAVLYNGGWIATLSDALSECYDEEYDLIYECTRLEKLIRQLWRSHRVNKKTDFYVQDLLKRIVRHYRSVDQYRGMTWEELVNDADDFGIESKKLAKETHKCRKEMQTLVERL